MPKLPGARSGKWEYHWATRIGLLRLCQEDDGLWASYLCGHRWVADFQDPDHLADWLASGAYRLPAALGIAEESSWLNLSSNLSDWTAVRVK